jgi:hypothetical protein
MRRAATRWLARPTQSASALASTQQVGGMLVGDDNKLYGATFPGSPLDAARWDRACLIPHPTTGGVGGGLQGYVAKKCVVVVVVVVVNGKPFPL